MGQVFWRDRGLGWCELDGKRLPTGDEQAARDRIKGLWQMQKRPELTPENEAKLKAIFDQDLQTLGQWLGVELTCDTFKGAAQVSPEGWPGWQAMAMPAASVWGLV